VDVLEVVRIAEKREVGRWAALRLVGIGDDRL
jgi:hypothetical protein